MIVRCSDCLPVNLFFYISFHFCKSFGNYTSWSAFFFSLLSVLVIAHIILQFQKIVAFNHCHLTYLVLWMKFCFLFLNIWQYSYCSLCSAYQYVKLTIMYLTNHCSTIVLTCFIVRILSIICTWNWSNSVGICSFTFVFPEFNLVSLNEQITFNWIVWVHRIMLWGIGQNDFIG